MTSQHVGDEMLEVQRKGRQISSAEMERDYNTWLNSACDGGQSQGTSIGFPSAPLTAPSQLPVPGLK
jgi:hypothetical protein